MASSPPFPSFAFAMVIRWRPETKKKKKPSSFVHPFLLLSDRRAAAKCMVMNCTAPVRTTASALRFAKDEQYYTDTSIPPFRPLAHPYSTIASSAREHHWKVRAETDYPPLLLPHLLIFLHPFRPHSSSFLLFFATLSFSFQ